MRGKLIAAASAAALAMVGTAQAADTTLASAPSSSWATTGNPYVFAVGDSVLDACVMYNRAGGGLGLGYRDLGHLAWPGATTAMVHDRLEGRGSWPAWTVTEDSNATEQVWFRDAGALLVGLGVNDVKSMSVEEYTAQVHWFVDQSRGRPLVWLTSHNPPFRSQTDQFNAVLRSIAASVPNMKVVEWDAFLDAHPEHVRGDGVHPADGAACAQYYALIDNAMAGEVGKDQPRGYLYGTRRTSDGVVLDGWASAWTSPRDDVPRIRVRVDFRQYATVPVTGQDAGGDPYAAAASGRTFSVRLPSGAAGHLVCLQITDPKGQYTSLGCRRV